MGTVDIQESLSEHWPGRLGPFQAPPAIQDHVAPNIEALERGLKPSGASSNKDEIQLKRRANFSSVKAMAEGNLTALP